MTTKQLVESLASTSRPVDKPFAVTRYGMRESIANVPPFHRPIAVKTRFLALDGLRGMAAIAVLLFHATPPVGVPWLAPHGFLAVDFFFALSGFVIAHAYGARLASGSLSPLRFAVRRYVRLWPSAALGTAIGIVAILVIVRPIPSSLGIVATLGFLLVPTMGTGGPFFPLNSPLWSLFDELLANGLHGAGGARLRTRDLAIVTAVAAFASASVFLADSRLFVGPIRVLYPYCAGVLVYSLNASKRYFPLGRVGAYALVAVMLGCFFLPEAHGIAEAAIRTSFIGVVVPLVVWAGAELRPPGYLVLPCQVAGEASYPLYALHVPIFALVFAGARPTSPSYIGYLAITCVLAVVVGRFYDAPVRHLLLARIEGRRYSETPIAGDERVVSG